MRYLVNVRTDEVVEVTDDDDARFYALLTERLDDGRQKYEQTGAHDERVKSITVPGESHSPSALRTAGLGDEDIIRGGEPAPFTALGDQPMSAADLKGDSPKSTSRASAKSSSK